MSDPIVDKIVQKMYGDEDTDKLTEALALVPLDVQDAYVDWDEMMEALRRWASFPTDDDVETFWRQANGKGVSITRSEVRAGLEAVKREDR